MFEGVVYLASMVIYIYISLSLSYCSYCVLINLLTT